MRTNVPSRYSPERKRVTLGSRAARSAGDTGTSIFPGAELDGEALGIVGQSTFGDVRRRFVRNKLAMLGMVMVSTVLVTAAFAPLLARADPNRQNLLDSLSGPSRSHWFGTDQLGRDQFSQVIYGTRAAVIVALSSVPIALVIAVVVGSLAGYLGGWWDTVLMRLTDMFYAFPFLIGLILIVLVVGRGLMSVIVALAVFGWATMARVLRSSVLTIREAGYVEAARSVGAGRWRIVTRHVLPNSLAPVLVLSVVKVATAVVALAGLGFLGIGAAPGTPDWGTMIATSSQFVGFHDYLWFFPSAAVVFTVLGFVLVGDGLRDAFDPRLR